MMKKFIIFVTALCRRVALRHTGIISAICLGAPYLGVTNFWFAAEALPLNIYFSYLGEYFDHNII